jgi:hypothetical protein
MNLFVSSRIVVIGRLLISPHATEVFHRHPPNHAISLRACDCLKSIKFNFVFSHIPGFEAMPRENQPMKGLLILKGFTAAAKGLLVNSIPPYISTACHGNNNVRTDLLRLLNTRAPTSVAFFY